MKKISFKPSTTIIVQLQASTEVDAIVDGGTVYVPLVSGLESVMAAEATAATVAKPSKLAKVVDEDDDDEDDAPAVKKKAVAEAATPAKSTKKLTEAQMLEMETSELKKICEDNKWKWPSEGKDTNKKFRLVILAKQGAAIEEEDEEDDAPAPKKSSGGTPDKKVHKIFTDLDADADTDVEALEGLVELGADKKDAKALIKKFLADAEGSVKGYVKQALSLLVDDADGEEEEEEEEEEEKPVAKKKVALLDADDLEEGQRVDCFWVDENSWFAGTVGTINKKGTLINYDDGTAVILDEEIVTKIKEGPAKKRVAPIEA